MSFTEMIYLHLVFLKFLHANCKAHLPPKFYSASLEKFVQRIIYGRIFCNRNEYFVLAIKS